MSASVMTTRDPAANPLDIMEQIVTANDWAFDRRGEAEMVAEAPAAGAITACISIGRLKSARCISPAPSI
jgi:hypothetical protein